MESVVAVVCSRYVLQWGGDYECCSGTVEEEAVVTVVWTRLCLILGAVR